MTTLISTWRPRCRGLYECPPTHAQLLSDFFSNVQGAGGGRNDNDGSEDVSEVWHEAAGHEEPQINIYTQADQPVGHHDQHRTQHAQHHRKADVGADDAR